MVALAVVLAACASPQDIMQDDSPGATTLPAPPQATSPEDAMGFVVRGDVPESFPIGVIGLSAEDWVVAVADDPTERNQGLRGVADLGELDGMLFMWDRDVTTTFGMLNVPIPLEIAWFAADGTLVDRTLMTPCDAEPCPSYGASGPFRYALETTQGGFDGLDPLVLTFDP